MYPHTVLDDLLARVIFSEIASGKLNFILQQQCCAMSY